MWKIYHRGVELGELDRESQELFMAKGILREGNFNSVTATSTGEAKDKRLTTTFRTASGNNFRIVHQPVTSPKFTGQTLDLQLISQQKPEQATNRTEVLFNSDSKKIKAGEFTNHVTSRQSIEILHNNRLWKEGVTFIATATSRNPHYKIEVDRSNIELPSKNNLAPVPESSNSLRAKIIKESIANPTLFSREGDNLRLSIDNLKVGEARDYLIAKNIPFQEIEPSIEEFERNYKILSISQTDLGEDDRRSFENKFEKPLETSDYKRKLSAIKSNGNRELKEQIFRLSVEKVSPEITPMPKAIRDAHAKQNNPDLEFQKKVFALASSFAKQGELTERGRRFIGKFSVIEQSEDRLSIYRQQDKQEIFAARITDGDVKIEAFNLSPEEIARFQQIERQLANIEPKRTSQIER